MVHNVEKGIIWEDGNSQIIFNPVGIDVFNTYLRETNKRVYDEYRDYMVGISEKKLIGDIQLVQISERKLIMNAYVFRKGKRIDLYALTKTLVELYNLATEYKLNISIPISMNSRNKDTISKIQLMLDVIFGDFEQEAYLYKNTPYYTKKNSYMK